MRDGETVGGGRGCGRGDELTSGRVSLFMEAVQS